jgi:hypothetical protein
MRPKTLDPNTVASHPGSVTLSHRKLRILHPELYSTYLWLWHLLSYSSVYPIKRRSFWRTYVEEHLMHGDSRAAVVISVNPLLIAAYTDEIDCIAMLRFDEGFVNSYRLTEGARLLTVNTYTYSADGAEPDLTPGPGQSGRYGNFAPYIAEFLTEDDQRVRQRKAEIVEGEWQKAEELGREYLSKRGTKARDGRPLRSLYAPEVSPFRE